MNKHEEARQSVNWYSFEDEEKTMFIRNYINEYEATEKAYEDTKYNLSVIKDNALKLQNELVELKRDVKRFMDSVEFTLGDIAIHTDLGKLIERLKKVGNE